MPVSESTVTSFTNMGPLGAVLLILLVFTVLLFYFQNKSTKSQKESMTEILNLMANMSSKDTEANGNKMDKLCDKIDLLVSSLAEDRKEMSKNQVANDKDQKELIKLLTMVNTGMLDIQKRVVRIDDRTFKCLGNPNKNAAEEVAAVREE